jgi:hypothetical protein
MTRRNSLPSLLRRRVENRAAGRCEYCKTLIENEGVRGVADHVIAFQHGGATSLDNLAFCCAHCNAHKGPNIAGVDPQSRQTVPIFNPRVDDWSVHFRWEGAVLLGLTPVGRATIVVLAINLPQRLLLREDLMNEGIF